MDFQIVGFLSLGFQQTDGIVVTSQDEATWESFSTATEGIQELV